LNRRYVKNYFLQCGHFADDPPSSQQAQPFRLKILIMYKISAAKAAVPIAATAII
jgi:hypothetical protein